MRIDLEQFLALAVAIGTVGAVGVAVYSEAPDLGKIANTIPTASDVDLSDAEAAAAAAASALPVAAEPTEPEPEPEDEGISPVVPDEDPTEAYGPASGSGFSGGPDVETPDW